jgi:hypothetical protein
MANPSKQSAIVEAIIALGGVYPAAEAAEISPAWMYKSVERGFLSSRPAYLLLRAARKVDEDAWPISRLAELSVDPATIAEDGNA